MKKPILKVALNVPIDNLFDYKIPSKSLVQPKKGQRVKVKFGKQEKVGFIHSITSNTSVPANKLRTVTKIIDDEVLINKDLFALISWVARYYHHPVSYTHLTLPTILLV